MNFFTWIEKLKFRVVKDRPKVTQFVNSKAHIQPQTWLVSKPAHYTLSGDAHKLVHIPLENEDTCSTLSVGHFLCPRFTTRQGIIHRFSDISKVF